MTESDNDLAFDEALETLGLELPSGFEIDKSRFFPKIKGMGWKGDVKRRMKFLNNCEPLLRKTVRPGEIIQYVGFGIQQKFIEQYFLGIWAQWINQTVFVFTNVRILAFNSNRQGKPNHTFWSIYYNEVDKFNKSLGSVKLKLKDGSKFTYSGFKGADKKSIPQIIDSAISEYAELGFEPTSSQSRENLCSHCLEVVPKGIFECANCHQEFFTPKELAKRSLIFPSWGDFSMGHKQLAFMELLGYVMTFVVFIAVIVSAMNENPNEALAVVGGMLLVLAIEHVSSAGLTYFLAKKGLTPKKGTAQAVDSTGEVEILENPTSGLA